MSWWTTTVPAGIVAIGWILTGRILVAQNRRINTLREQVAFLEAKVNGFKKGEP
jgi:uncharacterized integral membrane protein